MTKHILAAIGLLAITYPAQAQNVIPPAEYDHPYKGEVKIWRSASQDEIKSKCPPSAFPYHLGCGGPRSSGECHILMADDETIRKHGWTPEIVLRHEIGHCNGWPVDHKGARAVGAPQGAPLTTVLESLALSPRSLPSVPASNFWRGLP
jgi:hypothetical protein